MPYPTAPAVGVAVEFVPPLATGSVPVTPVVSGKPVRFVATPEAGVPKIGVTSVGEVDNTTLPVPVSSVTAPEKLAEVNDPNEVALPEEVTAPVKLALVAFAAATKAVVASWAVLVPAVAVGASGCP